jgi:chromosome segregation ATPase
MEAIREQVDLIPEVRTDVAAVKSDVAELKGRLTSVEVVLAQHSTALKKLDIRVAEIGSDVRTVKTRLTLIEGDLKEIKGYVGTHHEAIVELKTASHTH